MLGQNTSAHFLQKGGQITWADYLPGGAEYLGTAKSGGQNTWARPLGAAKSGAEYRYLGAAKSEADYLG